RHARERPDAPAFVCEGSELRWAGLAAQMDRIAGACLAGGLGDGDKVALLAAPSLRAIETFFGTVRAGCCIVPLATSATAEALLGMLRDSDAKVLVADADGRAILEAVEPALRDAFAGRLVALDFSAPGWLDWEAWLE